MNIPPILRDEIRDGNVVLFLGSGASLMAEDSHQRNPPTTTELGKLLSKKFLGDTHADLPLSQIGELCISECGDIVKVQEFIREIFEVFQPSSAHKILTSFRWWGIATTNYDRLIEQAYESSTHKIQNIAAAIDQTDRVEEKLRATNNLLLVKLHGCISRTANPNWPLILTADQYVQYRQGRELIFRLFTTWAIERHIVFIGHSLIDSDIRAVLQEVTTLTDSRPRHYIVAPNADPMQERFYETKKVSLLKGTFDEFINAIDSQISTNFRGLPIHINQPDLPISERFTSRDIVLSSNCSQFLQADVEYVKGCATEKTVSPNDFYKGLNPGWSAIEQNLDVPRTLTEAILFDQFLIEESKHSEQMEFILIKAYAGAGKSVLMRRLAWDAAHEYKCLCLYIKPFGIINSAAISELIRLCDERIYLFVDDAADRVREIQSLANSIGAEGKLLTIVAAERNNEWNDSCEAIAPLVSSENELVYLNTKSP